MLCIACVAVTAWPSVNTSIAAAMPDNIVPVPFSAALIKSESTCGPVSAPLAIKLMISTAAALDKAVDPAAFMPASTLTA